MCVTGLRQIKLNNNNSCNNDMVIRDVHIGNSSYNSLHLAVAKIYQCKLTIWMEFNVKVIAILCLFSRKKSMVNKKS
uniref:Uncharacterized protein n=1 Tax=Anguilla anguilla TaxID=7936 RepID=A0A0E9X6P0_ANGAN